MSFQKPDYEQAFVDGFVEVIKIRSKRTSDVNGLEVPKLSAKALRENMGISQQAFAEKFGIPIATLRNWEQGRNDPDGPTSLLLYLISRFPDFVAGEISRLRKK